MFYKGPMNGIVPLGIACWSTSDLVMVSRISGRFRGLSWTGDDVLYPDEAPGEADLALFAPVGTCRRA